MKKTLLSILLCLVAGIAMAQSNKIQIKGSIIDSLKAPVPFATVMLLNAKDSVMVNFGRTEENGSFEFKGIKRGNYFVKVSFMGYVPAQRKVEPQAAEDVVNMGVITLNPITKELMEVVVKATKNPLNVRGDTIVYNASAFKVGANATVEDLLKQMPGIDVAADGSIKAQGKEVKKVTVDGKTFFGDDPKLATKNLPAEAIDEVQVFDDKSEAAKATGIEDGKKEKTINLALKEDFKKGAFGKLMAGGGSIERFEGKGNYNKFSAKAQFSLLGLANNVNDQGFSWDDYQSFKGNQSFDFGAEDFGFQDNRFMFGDDFPFSWDRTKGFAKAYAGGMNYNFEQKKSKLSTSYFYNFNNSLQEVLGTQETFSESGSFKQDFKNINTTNVGNHRLNLKFEQGIDSLNTLVFKANSSLNNSDENFAGLTDYLTGQNQKTTTSDRTTTSLGNSLNFDGSLVWKKKFKKKGRSLAFKAGYTLNNQDKDETQLTRNTFFQAQSVNDFLRNINQLTANNAVSRNISGNIGYSEPLSKKIALQTFYNFGQNNDVVARNVSDKLDATSKLNTDLSRFYDGQNNFHRVGAVLRYAYKGKNFSAGLAGQTLTMTALNAVQENQPTLSNINRTFNNLLPKVSMEISMKNNKSVDFNYTANLRQPTLNELQPIPDFSNPFFISEGNPELKPEVDHSFRVGFNSFNMASNAYFYSSLNASLFSNQIIYNQTIDALFVTRTRPQNINGGNRLGFYGGYGFPVWKNKIKFDINANGSLGKNITFINAIENNTNVQEIGSRFGINIDPNQRFSASFNFSPSLSNTKYSLSSGQNQTLVNTSAEGSIRYTTTSEWSFQTKMNYLQSKNDRFNFNQVVPLWSAYVSKIFLKSKKAEIRLSVNDILNRNLGISQQAQQNFVSSNRTLSLGRYALLSFTYSLKTLGKPKEGNGGIIIIN